MKYRNAATGNVTTLRGYKRMARWTLLLVGCWFVLGCAAPDQRLADNKPRACHAGQILSCDVRGHGQTKSYSNCRCEYPREINTGFGDL